MNTVFNIDNSKDIKSLPSIHIQESHNLKIQMRERCKTIIDKNKKPIKKVTIGGKKIPVDAGIAPVIQILNDKGYKTVVCCEEHQRVLDELVKWAKSLPEHDKFLSQRMENWCRRPIGDINFENGEWDDYYDVAEDLGINLDKEWEEKWKCKLEEQYR